MNINELREVLSCKRVNESLYSLDGPAKQSESYSIVEDQGTFKVVYKERGQFTDVGANLTEDEACDLMYRLFRDAFGWTD